MKIELEAVLMGSEKGIGWIFIKSKREAGRLVKSRSLKVKG